MSRRIGLLAFALVVALLGTAAVFSYVSRVESRALAGAKPVDVLVAKERITAGTSAADALKRELVELTTLPRRAVPEGALSTVEDSGSGTLVSDMFAGEVLLKSKFAEQAARTGELLIPKEKIALSMEFDDPERVAGFVVPGSEVAVFATLPQMSGSATATATQDGNGQRVDVKASVDNDITRLLLPRVSVIAVGPATLRPKAKSKDEGDDESVATTILTVAVSQDEAERLVHAKRTGELYLGLLNTNSKTGPGAGVSNTTLFTTTGSQS